MQKIFKILATIAAWILFLMALMGFVWTFVAGPKESGFQVLGYFALWVVTLVLSGVVMKMRKSLE
jgi:hypothetical protein